MLTESDIDFIKNLLYESNFIAKSYRLEGLEVSLKPDKSFVSNADIAISKYLSENLAKIDIDAHIISEEGDLSFDRGEVFWLVDPIDGTRGYVKGYDLYSVNIALIHKGVPIFGFISIPESGYIYYTDIAGNLVVETKNGIENPPPSIELKAVLSGDPAQKSISDQLMKQYNIRHYEYIPSSVKFCLIASGEADLYPRHGRTMEWDTAAGSALIKASGGIVRDLDGNDLVYNKDGLVNKGFIAYSKRLFKICELDKNNE